MHASRAQLRTLERLKDRADFLKIQNKGQKWVSHGLVLQTLSCDSPQRRVGFTVSKKVDKSAVKRNRIKRRLRAVAAEVLPLYARASQDYVLVGRKGSIDRPYKALCNDLKWCLGKLDLLAEQGFVTEEAKYKDV